jgi:hypothetical protein
VQIIQSVPSPLGNLDALDCSQSTLSVNVHIWRGAKLLRSGRYSQTEDDITGLDYDCARFAPPAKSKE